MDDALRARLEALNRGALPSRATCSTTDQAPAQANIAARAARAAATLAGRSPRRLASPCKKATTDATARSALGAWRPGLAPPLVALLRRGAPAVGAAGEHWLLRLELDDVWPGGAELVARTAVARGAATRPAVAADPADLLAGFPRDHLFFDLETCGLAGSAVFLIGLLRFVEERWAIELLLARNYAEESAILAAFWQRCAPATTVVSFNGKSFDWPMLIDRSRRHRLAAFGPSPPVRHLDVLHLARRRWRRSVPDCKLQTLERRICGRTRGDDLPSAQIPAAYQQFVRTGASREVDAILRHNAIDLVTMLDLLMRLA